MGREHSDTKSSVRSGGRRATNTIPGGTHGGGSERFNHELLFSCSSHETPRYTLHENAYTDPHQQTGGNARGKFYQVIADLLRRNLCNEAAQETREYHRGQETGFLDQNITHKDNKLDPAPVCLLKDSFCMYNYLNRSPKYDELGVPARCLSSNLQRLV
jgi:hypothetical protein